MLLTSTQPNHPRYVLQILAGSLHTERSSLTVTSGAPSLGGTLNASAAMLDPAEAEWRAPNSISDAQLLAELASRPGLRELWLMDCAKLSDAGTADTYLVVRSCAALCVAATRLRVVWTVQPCCCPNLRPPFVNTDMSCINRTSRARTAYGQVNM